VTADLRTFPELKIRRSPATQEEVIPFIYRCPATGLKVQGLFADEVPTEKPNTYEPVTCLVCTRVHLVNRSTGKILDDDYE